MTPYCFGMPIDSIAPAQKNNPDLKWWKKCYQSIVGSINWLEISTHPDVPPALCFPASYSNAPSHHHYKSAIHMQKYLYHTCDYGISFHSNISNTLQAFNYFPHYHDKEAYSNTSPPALMDCSCLVAFSDACWRIQFRNTIEDGTSLELFKFQSISRYVCNLGGPSAGSQFNKTKLPSAPVKQISWQQMSVFLS